MNDLCFEFRFIRVAFEELLIERYYIILSLVLHKSNSFLQTWFYLWTIDSFKSITVKKLYSE